MHADRPRKPRLLRRSTASTLAVVALTSTVMLAQAPPQDDVMATEAAVVMAMAAPTVEPEALSPEEACWRVPSPDGAQFDCTALRPQKLPDAPMVLALHLPAKPPAARVPPPAEPEADCTEGCTASNP